MGLLQPGSTFIASNEILTTSTRYVIEIGVIGVDVSVGDGKGVDDGTGVGDGAGGGAGVGGGAGCAVGGSPVVGVGASNLMKSGGKAVGGIPTGGRVGMCVAVGSDVLSAIANESAMVGAEVLRAVELTLTIASTTAP